MFVRTLSFSRMASSKNCELPEEQVREYHDCFCMFDHGRGYIKAERIRDALKTIGFNPTDCFLEQMSMKVDIDHDKQLDFDEFLELIGLLVSEKQELKEGLFNVHL